jgi:hypothetical protein
MLALKHHASLILEKLNLSRRTEAMCGVRDARWLAHSSWEINLLRGGDAPASNMQIQRR